MAGRELRLAFAMGGGVSLGTFSGAALGEVIKLAVLKGGYYEDPRRRTNFRRYDRIVIDVFSGASAGAMSLAIMLRCLVHRTPEQEAAATAALKAELPASVWNSLSADQRADLVAAQVLLTTQEKVWRDEVHIKHMLGDAPLPLGKRDLRHIGAIFDRAEVDRIAKAYLTFPAEAVTTAPASKRSGPDDDGRRVSFKRRLLSSRVLYAATISNLAGIRADAAAEFLKTDVGLRALADGARSTLHREIRVFDLNFDDLADEDFTDASRNPRRWCRYHAAPEIDGAIGDVRRPRTWAKIAATAIASGAFPFAFEPVRLARKKYEFGPFWPEELADCDEHTFCYVDGGTFNNEPIREAFRLASFMDAKDDPATFDRVVVFVDPFVSDPPPDFRVPLTREYALQDPSIFGSLDGYDLVRCSSLDRLIPHVGTIMGAIMDESRVNEGDKVFKVRGRFAERADLRDALALLIRPIPTATALRKLRDFCEARLESVRENGAVPAGSLTVEGEVRRVILEQGGDASIEEIGDFLDSRTPQDHPRAAELSFALVCVAIDLVSDMVGKDTAGRLLVIAPIPDPSKKRAAPIDLPGGALHGFGGFCSRVNRDYEIALARYCAARFMEAFGLLERPASTPAPPRWTEEQQRLFDKDLREGIELLCARIERMLTQSSAVQIFPGLDGILLKALAGYAKGKLRRMATERPTRDFELRIHVPEPSFELDGTGFLNDLKPIRDPITGALALITYAKLDPDGTWSGGHITNGSGGPGITVDINGALTSFCRILLPPVEAVDGACLSHNPRFDIHLDKTAHRRATLKGTQWRAHAGDLPLEDELAF